MEQNIHVLFDLSKYDEEALKEKEKTLRPTVNDILSRPLQNPEDSCILDTAMALKRLANDDLESYSVVMRIWALFFVCGSPDQQLTLFYVLNHWLEEDSSARLPFLEVAFPIMGCEWAKSPDLSVMIPLIEDWVSKQIYAEDMCLAILLWFKAVRQSSTKEREFYDRMNEFDRILAQRAKKDIEVMHRLSVKPATQPLGVATAEYHIGETFAPDPKVVDDNPGSPMGGMTRTEAIDLLRRKDMLELQQRISASEDLIQFTEITMSYGGRILVDYHRLAQQPALHELHTILTYLIECRTNESM